jgi:hypothetical protein
VVALAVLVPLVAVATFLIWQDYSARRQYLMSTLELRSEQVNTQIEDFVTSTRSSARLLARAFERQYPDIATQLVRPAGEVVLPSPELIDLLAASPDVYERASVVALDGTMLASSSTFTAGDQAPDHGFAMSLRGADDLVVSDVFGPASGSTAPSAMFAYPIDDSSGRPVAYLVLRSSLVAISNALDMTRGFPTSARSGIFDAIGRVLAASAAEPRDNTARVGADIASSAVWAQARTRPTEPWYGPGLDGVQRIIFFEYPAGTPWITTVAYAQSELLGPLWTRVLLLSAGLAVSVLGTLALAELADARERRALTLVMRERQVQSRREVAREAQHHVRNALQVLRLRQGTETNPNVEFFVDDAIERIEWVLSEILPGEVEGPRQPPEAARRVRAVVDEDRAPAPGGATGGATGGGGGGAGGGAGA